MKALHVARDAILALLDSREVMSIQLTHAHGGMTDEEFDTLLDAHLDNAPLFDEARTATVAACLAGLVPEKFDADLVSIAARCTLEQASRAIQTATENLDKILPFDSDGPGYILASKASNL